MYNNDTLPATRCKCDTRMRVLGKSGDWDRERVWRDLMGWMMSFVFPKSLYDR